MGLKQRVWEVMTVSKQGDRLSQVVDIFILSMIFLNVLAVILESVESLASNWRAWFLAFEYISVSIFSTEYLLRLWACTICERYRHPLLGRLRFICSPMAIIDLLAILPSILLLQSVDTRSIRALRLMRIFMLAKTGRYLRSVRLLGKVFISKKEELLVTFGLLSFLLVLTSTLMYVAENKAQPEAFSSIPAAMWWAVATLTTVGYGDVTPITAWGRLLGSVVAIIGIGLFALPTSILGAGFIDEFQSHRKKKRCPHCGMGLNAEPNANAQPD